MCPWRGWDEFFNNRCRTLSRINCVLCETIILHQVRRSTELFQFKELEPCEGIEALSNVLHDGPSVGVFVAQYTWKELTTRDYVARYCGVNIGCGSNGRQFFQRNPKFRILDDSLAEGIWIRKIQDFLWKTVSSMSTCRQLSSTSGIPCHPASEFGLPSSPPAIAWVETSTHYFEAQCE